MGEEHGHYERVGDVDEWRWDKGHEPKVNVPEGGFDPRDVVSTTTAPAVVPPKKAPARKRAARKQK